MFSYDEYRNIIDDCLRHHKFSISIPEDERLSILKRLQYPQNNIELYQYRKCNERNFNNFKMNQVTLVHPKYFNDSFEIMPYLNLKDFIKKYNLFDINVAKKYLGIVKERDFTPEEIQEIGGENTAQLLKDISRKFTELRVEENYYNNFEEIQYNALMQMAPLLKQICDSKQNETRIACFSESYDSPIMWGHYADSAKGFCIKRSFTISLCMSLCPIDSDRECEKSDSCVKSNCIKSGNNWLLPVIYCSQRPDFTPNIEEQLIQTIFQLLGMKADWSNYDLLSPLKFSCYKSIDWSYEREWRWIRTYCTDIIPEFSPISIGSISGLYLGEHISQADEIILKDYASLYKLPDGTNIPIYKMKSNLCTPSYKLTAERIK